jgi:integrating conjugative element protein (TIGR03758 family)
MMSAAQLAAFQAGSGVSAATLLLGIATVTLLLSCVWAAWVTLGTFRSWQEGNGSLFDLAWSVIRASIILMVLSFFLR